MNILGQGAPAASPAAGLWYALIMLGAIAAGWLAALVAQRRLLLPWRQRAGLALGAFCGAMIAAKLPFVLADWQGLLSGRAWLSDGKTIMFGLVGGYFGVELVKGILNLRIKTGDSYAVPVAVAIGIGRLACFQAGCCHGTATSLPWGVRFHDGLPRHPTQLYETLFHLTAACVLLALLRRGLFRQQLIKLYFLAYFTYRFATEFIRPEPRVALGLTGYQWAALAFAPLFAALWYFDRREALTAEGRVMIR
jgi:phosphatidylglycerol:prolipoprotein diacylglycerol transferase